jgi:DNA-binding beta-propeller fold protein YncE
MDRVTARIRSLLLGGVLLGSIVMAGPDRALAQTSSAPEADYWVWVGAESDDLIHRIRFGPDGAVMEKQLGVGVNPTETEGPHGLAVSPDGRYLYMTTGHGTPDGMLWKYELGPDTLVAGPTRLGRFPASLDVTPDGLFVFVANFNLHGQHVPSTMSAAYGPELYEIEQIELCVMPHGARVSPSGNRIYTVCMMDEQLVEVDAGRYEVARRFSVAEGSEGPIEDHGDHAGHHGAHAGGGVMSHDDLGCSPTWASPHPEGDRVYVACNRGDRILEVDLEGWSLARTFETGRGPYNLEVTPDGRLLVVTLKQGNAVEFIDLTSGETVGRSETSTTVVHGVALSPDSRYAFVSVEGVGQEPGKVDVFDLETFERVADVPIGRQASGIAFWKMEER